jgi:hypothetical protein
MANGKVSISEAWLNESSGGEMASKHGVKMDMKISWRINEQCGGVAYSAAAISAKTA